MIRVRLLILLLFVLVLALPLSAQDAPLIGLGSTEELGSFLVDSEGFTLYMFNNDPLGETVCYDTCAERWPPLLVDSADAITVAEGIPGEFSTVERTDGTLQVAYNGMPLYYWVRDEAAGETKGNRVGNVWWVVPPATAYAFRNGDTPARLVGPTGMTLYIFTNDEPGVSNCVDDCATNWPPLTVESADALVPGLNLWGEWGTIERADGTIQVTYNGWPLYYFAQDMARGDANGEGRGDVWYTVPAETVALDSNAELGDYLVAYNGMTLYTFANDEAGVSNCADDCAEAWPPFTVRPETALAGGPGVTGELATIERADGALQVTYNGMPLYFWGEDAAPGDTTGQGVGDVWYVVSPEM
jgi:predicted lipoprotein with Yx(FWY)xxD motif